MIEVLMRHPGQAQVGKEATQHDGMQALMQAAKNHYVVVMLRQQVTHAWSYVSYMKSHQSTSACGGQCKDLVVMGLNGVSWFVGADALAA